jgi:hypothetical protein
MAWAIFGGYFLYGEHAPMWLQIAFYVAVAVEFAWEHRKDLK